MKRARIRFLLVAATAVAAAGCARKELTINPPALAGLSNPSVHILTQRNRTAPRTGTFGWGYCLFRVPQDRDNQLGAVSERLQAALRNELTGKGLRFAESDPDVLVSYALASEGTIAEDELDTAYAELLKQPVHATRTDLNYQRGVFVLDVVDRISGHLLWRGAILADIDLAWPEERKQERCNAVVAELLRHYPEP